MKKHIVLFLICIALLIVDNTLVPYVEILGYYPNILFTFVIIYSFISEIEDAVFLGVISGMLQDIYFYDVMGMNAFTNLVFCAAVCYLGRNFIKDKLVIPIVATFLASLLKGVFLFVFMKILNVSIQNGAIFYSSIYNVFVCILMVNMVHKLYKVEFMKRRWGFKEN